MLVLTRKAGEEVVLPSLGVKVSVVGIEDSRVRLGVTAPDHVAVLRGEIRAADDCELRRHVARSTGGRLRDVEVERCGGRIIVRGSAGSYYVRQLAEAAVLRFLRERAGDPADVAVDIRVAGDAARHPSSTPAPGGR